MPRPGEPFKAVKSFSHILRNHETNEGATVQTHVLKMAEARDAGLWKIEDVVKDVECHTGFTIASRQPVPGKYDGVSNAELKKQLTARELASGGNKFEMVARLKRDDDAEPGEHCSTKFSRWVGRAGCASKLSSAAGAGETDARAAPGPYAGMTVPPLKAALRTRGLTITGRKKADLLERLAASDAAAAATTTPDVASAAAAGAAGGDSSEEESDHALFGGSSRHVKRRRTKRYV